MANNSFIVFRIYDFIVLVILVSLLINYFSVISEPLVYKPACLMAIPQFVIELVTLRNLSASPAFFIELLSLSLSLKLGTSDLETRVQHIS